MSQSKCINNGALSDVKSVVKHIINNKMNKVKSVTYQYVNKFSGEGGSHGSQTTKFSITTGKTSKTGMTNASHSAIEAAASISASGFGVSGKVSVGTKDSWDTGSVRQYSSEKMSTKTETWTIDMSAPCYIYQKLVTVNYENGRSQTIGLGKIVSDKEIPQPKTTQTIHACA